MFSSKKFVAYWVVFMFFITFTCSLAYLVMQQSIRLGANELPKQIAVDTEIHLQQGKNLDSVIPDNKIDISKSLDPFIMIFDNNKQLSASSGVIGEANPSFPKGVLDHVTSNSEDKVTWQPRSGLRFATVAIKYNNGYIVGARSLQETENLIGDISTQILFIWSACLVFSTILLFVILKLNRKTT